jgi:hypothetical protein
MRTTLRSVAVMAAVVAPAWRQKRSTRCMATTRAPGRVARLQISDVDEIEVTLAVALGPRAGRDRSGHRSAGMTGLSRDPLGEDQQVTCD